MHRPCPAAGSLAVGHANQVHKPARLRRIAGGSKSEPVPELIDQPPAERLRQQLRRPLVSLQCRRHTMKSAQRVLRRHRTRPGLHSRRRRCRNQFQQHPVGIGEADDLFAKARRRVLNTDTVRFQTLQPIADRTGRDGVCRGFNLTGAAPSPPRSSPGKERQQSPRRAARITEIEMIRARVIEVDRSLDEPQPQHAAIEVQVVLRIRRDRSDVMEARDWHGPR